MPPSPCTAVLFCVPVLLAAGTAAAADPAPWEHQERSSTTLHGGVRKVVVDLDAGAVTLQQGRVSRVSTTSTWFRTKPSVSVSVRDGVLTVTGRCPDFVTAPAVHVGDPMGSCRTDVSVSLAGVPAGVAVDTRAGDVTVTGVRGPVGLASGNGDVRARQLRGPVRVTAGYGDADLMDVVASDLQVSTHGDAGLTRVRSSRAVGVRAAFGRVSGVAVVAPVMRVTSSAGSAQLVNARVGALTLTTDGGPAVLNDSTVSTADVSTGTEEASLSGVTARSRITVRTQGGAARLTELRTPRLDVDAGTGGVELSASRVGGARLHTGGGPVAVRGLAFGTLAVDAGAGGVGVSTGQPFRALAVTTSDGDVDVTVPSGAYALLVRSDTGQASVSGVTADSRAGCSLSVGSSSGDIAVHGR